MDPFWIRGVQTPSFKGQVSGWVLTLMIILVDAPHVLLRLQFSNRADSPRVSNQEIHEFSFSITKSMDRRNPMKIRTLNTAMVWFCIPLCAQSQMKTGVIEGVARDSSGNSLSGVTVTLKHLGIGISRTYRTSSHGLFSAPLLPPGMYEVSARRRGFARTTIPTVPVAAGRPRAIEFIMQPFDLSASVKDKADAAAEIFSQPESNAIWDNSLTP